MTKLDFNNYEKFLSRLEKLNSNSQSKWGKMNISQMMKHCNYVMETYLKKVPTKSNFFIKIFFGKMIKKTILSNKEYAPNLPTEKSFIIKDSNLDFETEKNKLKKTIEEFVKTNDDFFENFKHPVLGTFTSDQIRFMQGKHLDHHFRQFGV